MALTDLGVIRVRRSRSVCYTGRSSSFGRPGARPHSEEGYCQSHEADLLMGPPPGRHLYQTCSWVPLPAITCTRLAHGPPSWPSWPSVHTPTHSFHTYARTCARCTPHSGAKWSFCISLLDLKLGQTGPDLPSLDMELGQTGSGRVQQVCGRWRRRRRRQRSSSSLWDFGSGPSSVPAQALRLCRRLIPPSVQSQPSTQLRTRPAPSRGVL